MEQPFSRTVGKTYIPIVHSVIRNDKRMLCFPTTWRANKIATHVRLHLCQNSTNACVVSPVSDHSVADRIASFCNRYNVLCTTNLTTPTVEQLNYSTKAEREQNGMLTSYCNKKTCLDYSLQRKFT